MTATAAYVVDLQRKWAIVGAAFQDEHPACNEECPHYRSISQRHPYGNGHATEYLCDCSLGEQLRDKPEDCPAYQSMTEEA